MYRIADFLRCPNCGSGDVSFRDGYRENGVRCERCGLEEGDITAPEITTEGRQ